MPDQNITKLAAAAPLGVSALLVLLTPLFERLIESGAEHEFNNGLYLGPGQMHTPISLITKYTSWVLDVAQAGPLVLVPLVGLTSALSGNTNGFVGWIDAAFVFVGFVIFLCTVAVKNPVQYGGKKLGFMRDGKLWFGWTRLSIAAIILYSGASVLAFIVA